MDIYIDCADVTQWKLPAGIAPVVGITTNPSLIFQAGLSVTLLTYERLLKEAGGQGFSRLMLQLPSADLVQAQTWVSALQKVAAQEKVELTIKLPCMAEWLSCIKAVQNMKQKVLLTGLSNPVQLLWAQSLGVDFVAPYVGRLAADTALGGRDVWSMLEACVAVQNEKGPSLLAASIKTPDVLSRLIAIGAAAVTLPPASLVAWSQDAITQAAVAQFAKDTELSLKLV